MRFVFACAAAHGHINPTLPVAKALVHLGHEVHYVCFEEARAKIEAHGATFHSFVEVCPEFFAGRSRPGLFGALADIESKLGLDESFLSWLMLSNVVMELELPGVVRFLHRLKPHAVVYDPLLSCRTVYYAARFLDLPAVALLTLAGPGGWLDHGPDLLQPLTLADANHLTQGFMPHTEATQRLQKMYGFEDPPCATEPDGLLDTLGGKLVLVTTSEELQDPMPASLAEAYANLGTKFAYVGPLLSVPTSGMSTKSREARGELLSRVHAARAEGRDIILISMGTLVTSDHPINGWRAQSNGRSLTGCELCRAVWAAAFETFGDREDVLLVVSLGRQPDALGDLQVPSNAVCAPDVPQVEVLQAGVMAFLTHGGQNSFMEAMAYGTPIVVCPGFGDQKVNAAKAVHLGVGLKVDRPQNVGEDERSAVAAQYKSDVCQALQNVCGMLSFRAPVEDIAKRVQGTAGVPGAVELILGVATKAGVMEAKHCEEMALVGGA